MFLKIKIARKIVFMALILHMFLLSFSKSGLYRENFQEMYETKLLQIIYNRW